MKSAKAAPLSLCAWLTAEAVAARLSVHPQAIYGLCRRWRSSGGRVGLAHAMLAARTLRISEDAVERYMRGVERATAGAAQETHEDAAHAAR